MKILRVLASGHFRVCYGKITMFVKQFMVNHRSKMGRKIHSKLFMTRGYPMTLENE